MSDFKSSGISEGITRPQSPASKKVVSEKLSVAKEQAVTESQAATGNQETVQQAKASEKTDQQKETSEQVRDAVTRMQDYVQNMERSINFRLDEESGITVIRVYDAETEELIRQIPNEEAVNLAQKLNEEPLMLFSAKV